MKLIKITLTKNCSNVVVKEKYLNNVLMNGGLIASCGCATAAETLFGFLLHEKSEIFLINNSEKCKKPSKETDRVTTYFEKLQSVTCFEKKDTCFEEQNNNNLIVVNKVNSNTNIKYIFDNAKTFYIWNPFKNILYIKEIIFSMHSGYVIDKLKSVGNYKKINVDKISDLFN